MWKRPNDFFVWHLNVDGVFVRMRLWVGGTLAIEMVCCSMASWMATLSSSLIWETKRFCCNMDNIWMKEKKKKEGEGPDLVKLVDADHATIGQNHGSALHDKAAGVGVSQHRGRQTSRTAALARGVHLRTHHYILNRRNVASYIFTGIFFTH